MEKLNEHDDFTTLLKPYENKWVALSPDYTQVVVSGETLKEAHARVLQGEREPVIFHKVLPFDALAALITPSRVSSALWGILWRLRGIPGDLLNRVVSFALPISA